MKLLLYLLFHVSMLLCGALAQAIAQTVGNGSVLKPRGLVDRVGRAPHVVHSLARGILSVAHSFMSGTSL